MRATLPIPARLVALVGLTLASLVVTVSAHAQLSGASLPTYGPSNAAVAVTPDDPAPTPVADTPTLAFSRLVAAWNASVAPRLATLTRWDPRAAFDAVVNRPAADRTRSARLGAR